MSTHFYLSKGQKTVGPCTLDDLRSYLAYGSVTSRDMVKRVGESQWMQLSELRELTQEEAHQETAGRRRVARYRDYGRVPDDERAGWVLKQLTLGFLLFPPLLWRGAAAVYRGRIFSHRKDEHGYLIKWPRRAEIAISLLLILNSLTLWCAILWLADQGTPLAREVLVISRSAISNLQDWLGHVQL